jgi:hypothetical protein
MAFALNVVTRRCRQTHRRRASPEPQCESLQGTHAMMCALLYREGEAKVRAGAGGILVDAR